MNVENRLGDTRVLHASGRLSWLDLQELGRLLRAGDHAKGSHVVLDLGAGEGIAEDHLVLMLLTLRCHLQRRGARLVLVPPAESYARLSRNLALDEVLAISATVPSAGAGPGEDERPAGAWAGEDGLPAAGREATLEPMPMTCQACGTTWYSRVAVLIAEAGLSCAACGGRLQAGDPSMDTPADYPNGSGGNGLTR
jgi:hypothetical protein